MNRAAPPKRDQRDRQQDGPQPGEQADAEQFADAARVGVECVEHDRDGGAGASEAAGSAQAAASAGIRNSQRTIPSALAKPASTPRATRDPTGDRAHPQRVAQRDRERDEEQRVDEVARVAGKHGAELLVQISGNMTDAGSSSEAGQLMAGARMKNAPHIAAN